LLGGSKKLIIIGTILFCVFLVAGGLSLVTGLTSGFYSYADARFGLSAPFFALFVLVGFFGLLMAYKQRGTQQGLFGLLIVLFCYVCIEVLYSVCGGV
jgi:hypothetical protein